MAEPADQRSTEADSRLKEALLAHVREGFGSPVSAIVGYCEILLEDAPRLGLERFVADLEKVLQSGLALQAQVDGLLDTESLEQREDESGYGAFRGRLRHDLRTPINAIKGYGEMLLEDAQDAGAPESFVRDLGKLLAESEDLLGRIDALVEFTHEDVQAAADAPAPVIRGLIGGVPLTEADKPDKQQVPSRILVVDDHKSNRDLLQRRLSREGHTIETAESGKRALEVMDRGGVDLVLLDLLMPDMSGYEVLCRLKADPRHRDVPVVMISALDDLGSIVRCIEAGAEDYLPKPFEAVLLRARINSCLEKKRLRDRERKILEELRVEKEKSEALLLNILPKPIVDRLQLGETVIADRVSDATILFADLVGFTKLSTRMPPAKLLDMLNVLFTDFDRLTKRFGLEKIKTIGDAYMVVGGLWEDHTDHAEAVAEMGLSMLDSVRTTGVKVSEPLHIRVGMHTGPVVAGIIGTHKFIYDIWGDTVNTASRLESHGEADRINVSIETYERLKAEFVLEHMGQVDLKGKGLTERYVLKGRRAA